MLLCFLVNGVMAVAQPSSQHPEGAYRISHLTPLDGLVSGKVISVAQDSMGYLWIGTEEGLHRYDGHELQLYQHVPGDSTSLSHNSAEVIYLDRQGTLWVGTWDGLNRYDPRKDEFRSYRHQPHDPAGLPGRMVIDIQEDSSGSLWLAIAGGGVCRFEPETETFVSYRSKATDPTGGNPFNPCLLYLDRAGTLWVGSGSPWDEFPNRGGLHRYDPERDEFVAYLHDPQDPYSLVNNEITTLYEDRNGIFWVATWGDGLQFLDRESGKFYPAEDNPVGQDWPSLRTRNGQGGGIRFLHEDAQGQLWIGGFLGGLDRYDPLTGNLTHYQQGSPGLQGITDLELWSIFEDANQVLWISTWNGLNKLVYQSSPHKVIGHSAESGLELHDLQVEALLSDPDGRVWAGTWAGLELLDLDQGNSRLYELENEVAGGKGLSKMVLCLTHGQKDNVWVGSLSHGLQNFNLETEGFEPLPRPDPNEGSLINDIYQSPSGNIWGISVHGIYVWNSALGSGYSPPQRLGTDSLVALDILVYQDSMAWLGTASGLYHLNLQTQELNSFLTGFSVETILEGNSGVLWAGTQGDGLLKVDLQSKTYTTFTTAEGLPSNNIRGLLLDQKGRLWVATRKGVCWLEQGQKSLQTFPASHAPKISEFFPSSAIVLPDGKLMFGGRGGILQIDPSLISRDSLAPRPVISRLKVLDQEFRMGPGSGPNQFQLIGQEASFAHDQNDLSFEFGALHFVQPEENTYRYRLDPIEKDWRKLGSQRGAIYPNLSPGRYTFQVQAANPGGVWSSETASMLVIIRSPWWQTIWAYLTYGLLSLGLLWTFFRFQRRRLIRKERARVNLLEAKLRAEAAEAQAHQLQELDDAKARLYANITHEFRTPLTVILGMAERLTGQVEEQNLILRNSQHLWQLINQLLDLSKLESGKLNLHLVQGDIIPYLRYLTESFHSLAQEKKIRLHFQTSIDTLVMDYDEQKIQHLVYNLISNAIKFTPNGGKVTAQVSQTVHNGRSFLSLQIADTGVGIQPGQLDQIFDRFYQADNSSTRRGEGTGIGLALTKELVELMQGEIQVESHLGIGSTFTLRLPIALDPDTPIASTETLGRPATVQAHSEDRAPLVNGGEEHSDKPVLVLIEDNRDVRTYITRLLQDRYQLYTEVNGQAGIDRVIELIPDVVISDVMMPEKDGFEVCKVLKSDERSSHIPIILLTARGEDRDRIKGFSQGADAYLHKPFNQEELFVRLAKLIELRQTLKQKYADPRWLSLTSGQVKPSLEDRFLLKLAEVVRDNLDNPHFGVKDLCAAAHLSNMQVNRKLKALTDKTPSRFIRSVRLQEAIRLISTEGYNVSEAAYAVGFSDPNYFSRSFSEEFGYPPSELGE